ncbi:hypothetical protein [Haloplanus halophilus]|uniref:hypothetical protein n=1 Tax=Haloplanus halophilus TaxID=2949993 RepID=UPI0020425AE5|nr:hypothetical protein [Haloplanus sp. GDY1]
MVVDRDRGILTQGDREYLAGESSIDPKSQSERNARSRIRNRVRNGLLDFRYLSDPEYFEDRDLDLLREYVDEDGEAVTQSVYQLDAGVSHEPMLDPEVEQALAELVAFAFRVSPSTIETIVEQGVKRGVQRLFPEAEVGDVQVPIEDPEGITDRIKGLIKDDTPLTETEIRVALEQDVRPAEEIAAHVRKHGTRETGGSRSIDRGPAGMFDPKNATAAMLGVDPYSSIDEDENGETE